MTLSKQNAPVWYMDYNAGHNRLASTSLDGTIALWDTLSGNLVSSLTEDTVRGTSENVPVRFTPDGKWLVSAGNQNIRVRDPQTGVIQSTLTTGALYDIAISPDSQSVAYTGPDGIYVQNLTTQAQTQIIQAAVGAYHLTFNADASVIAATVGNAPDRRVYFWSVKMGQGIGLLMDLTSKPEAIAFNPDGTLLAAGSDDGTITFWGTVAP